jgi:hypothetical protein
VPETGKSLQCKHHGWHPQPCALKGLQAVRAESARNRMDTNLKIAAADGFASQLADLLMVFQGFDRKIWRPQELLFWTLSVNPLIKTGQKPRPGLLPILSFNPIGFDVSLEVEFFQRARQDPRKSKSLPESSELLPPFSACDFSSDQAGDRFQKTLKTFAIIYFDFEMKVIPDIGKISN